MMIVVMTLGVLFNRISWVDMSLLSPGLYTILLIIFLFGQFILLGFIDNSKENRNVNPVIKLSRIVIWISQILLSVLLIILLVEIVNTSKYHTILLTAICCISYAISIIFTVILVYKFFSWFKRQKNVITIVYGIASLIIAINLIITLLFSITVLSSRPDEVQKFLVSSGIFVRQETFADIAQHSVPVLFHSNVCIHVGRSAVILYYYSKKIGRLRFWLLVAIPLVYFLSQFLSNMLSVSMVFGDDPVVVGIILTTLFTISLVIGGILFGIAFIKLSSRFSKSDAIRNYLIVAGYGFMFLLITNNGILLATVPYPPYADSECFFHRQ